MSLLLPTPSIAHWLMRLTSDLAPSKRLSQAWFSKEITYLLRDVNEGDDDAAGESNRIKVDYKSNCIGKVGTENSDFYKKSTLLFEKVLPKYVIKFVCYIIGYSTFLRIEFGKWFLGSSCQKKLMRSNNFFLKSYMSNCNEVEALAKKSVNTKHISKICSWGQQAWKE